MSPLQWLAVVASVMTGTHLICTMLCRRRGYWSIKYLTGFASVCSSPNGSIALSPSVPVSSPAFLLPHTHLAAHLRHSFRLLLCHQQHNPRIPKLRRPLRYHHIHHIPFPELLCHAVQQCLPLQFPLLRSKSSRRCLLYQPLHGSNVQCAGVPDCLQYVHHPHHFPHRDKSQTLTDAVIER